MGCIHSTATNGPILNEHRTRPANASPTSIFCPVQAQFRSQVIKKTEGLFHPVLNRLPIDGEKDFIASG